MLEDIAVLTGGQLIVRRPRPEAREHDPRPTSAAPSASTIDKDNTTIVEAAGKAADIQARIAQIRAQIEETTSDYDREKLQERLAKLAGGVAVINVGAATEVEMKEKKPASRTPCTPPAPPWKKASFPAAASRYLRAILRPRADRQVDEEEAVGVRIVRRALEEPLRQIATNAGIDGSIVVNARPRRKPARSATTPPPTNTKTSSRPASSTPPR
jgi:chaperonin GroEL